MSEQIFDRVANVEAVNADGTVNITVGGGYVSSVPALDSYLLRAVGDRVLVRVRDAQMVVLGRCGPAVEIPTSMDLTLSDSPPPDGQGWQQITAWWAKPGPPGSLWGQRPAPYVPPPPTPSQPARLTRVSTDCDTYRGGSRMRSGYAEQGDYTGRGLQAGIWVFGAAAWAPLGGKIIDGVSVEVARRSVGHGFTYGPVDIVFRAHNGGPDLPDALPAFSGPHIPGSLGLGASAVFTLPIQWGVELRDGISSGVGIYSDDARANLEAEARLVLHVDYH